MITMHFLPNHYLMAVDPKKISEGMWVIMDYTRGGRSNYPDNTIILGQLKKHPGSHRIKGYGFFARTRLSKPGDGSKPPLEFSWMGLGDFAGDFKLSLSPSGKTRRLSSKSGAPIYSVKEWKAMNPDWEADTTEQFWAPMKEEK